MDRQLTPRQLAALKARRDLTAFCFAVYPPYTHAPHLAMIDKALAGVTRYIETGGAEGIGRLRIELPPRHGKSVKAARLYPSWVMGRNPDLRVILASHGAQLSEGHSRAVRNTIRSAGYMSIFPRVHLADDSQARDAWDLADPYQGGMFAVGTGGAVTGRGAGLIICDDLIKSREEAESQTQRDKLYTWYTDDLLTRQEPNAAIIHIGTRWHGDDILGRLQLNEADSWHVICLPALAEDNDPLGREPGDPLWPERFDTEALSAQRSAMGDYSFSALYQQSPISASGGVFKRDQLTAHLVDSEPVNIVNRVRFWDLAISEKKSADYTVGTLMGCTEDKRYCVLDVQRFRLGWQGVMDKISEVAQADGPDVRIGVEQVAFSAAAVIQLVQRPELHSHSIVGIEVHKDKLTRALPFAARIDAGMLDILRRAWTADFLDELTAFPNGKHDDQVDSAASAYEMMGEKPADRSLHGQRYNPIYGTGAPERGYTYRAAVPLSKTAIVATSTSIFTASELVKAIPFPAAWHTVQGDLEISLSDLACTISPKPYFIRADTGMVYCCCMRCQSPQSDLYISRNFNLICEACKQEENLP